MLTETEVTQLYRNLLGRDPEDAATIRDFQDYYQTLDRGRKAVFGSDEFNDFYARVTGLPTHARDLAASLALGMLRQASAQPAPVASPPAAPEVARAMRIILDQPGAARLAVAVGEPAGLRLDDLVPLGHRGAAVLHLAPGFPAAAPWAGALEDGTTLFRLAAGPAQVAEILAAQDARIDALCLLGPPGGPDWAQALKPHLARRALILVGRPHAGFDAPAVSTAIADAHHGEPVQHWQGLRLHHIGGWLLPVGYQPPLKRPPAPDRAAYPRLAIATIVRNEAVCIANMLRSVLPIASFCAVLDTGSADATLQIARDVLEASGVPGALAQGDHAAFDDDFAAMRNAALALVPDGIDWVLMLDGDEELEREDHAPLLHLIAGASPSQHAFALPRYNYTGADKSGLVTPYPDRQVRLLRHMPGSPVRYQNPVHETIRSTPHSCVPLDESAMGGPRNGPHIHHLVRRFRTPTEEDAKQQRYREIAARHGIS